MTLSLRFQQTSSFKLILQNPCQIVLVMFVLMGTELQLVSHSFAGLANKDTIDHTRFSSFHLVQESQDIKEIAANCSKHSKAFEGLKQKTGLNGLPFIALNINFLIKTSVGHTDSLLSQVIPSSSVT